MRCGGVFDARSESIMARCGLSAHKLSWGDSGHWEGPGLAWTRSWSSCAAPRLGEGGLGKSWAGFPLRRFDPGTGRGLARWGCAGIRVVRASVCMCACVSSLVQSCPVAGMSIQLPPIVLHSNLVNGPDTSHHDGWHFFYFLSLFSSWTNAWMAKIRLLPGGTPAV